ncbi:MAG: cytochrome c [Candidatus Thiodiazotropha sp. (ex Lucinoma aequizonata)]|nr:cytochrome c [Candidatus Thiodiazotropha sp. (ex Lucinoma aequizonata)]MCU7889623.1 cytochrome c [Candidatus Thiodiazotropha sp. (ex Lucinoma aequizonata)]MCU7894172.1 cytochrome c [Candidatus Thiodiazotropha sp. (ex Lucinoma aequizonata)]MCU7900047.1 cytochrome c [Candidatus Thiodiazotropha sp. (ex Lucinoma aequizonata)]MCU7902496.1 cytochrome c [Candidatus Thiodiazotropha sp. (ex Lucinoma aequizonata)]
MTKLTGVTLLVLLLTGCSEVNDFKPVAGMDAMDVYAKACSNCHGEGGSGKFGMFLKIADSDEETDEIVDKVLNGGHIMPAFPNINKQQAESIAAYLKAL